MATEAGRNQDRNSGMGECLPVLFILFLSTFAALVGLRWDRMLTGLVPGLAGGLLYWQLGG